MYNNALVILIIIIYECFFGEFGLIIFVCNCNFV